MTRMRINNPLLALLATCGLVFLSAEAWAWQTNISGTAGGGTFNAVAVDEAGNVVAAGSTTNTDTGGDFTVVKFDGASGAEVWRYVITGNATRTPDVANAVAIDGAGNVVAAGVIFTTCLGANCGPLSDFIVVKLDGATGVELWRQIIDDSYTDMDPTGVEDVAYAVSLDGAGNVVAAGALGYSSIVPKLDGANGGEWWRRVMTGSAGRNPINAVAVDAVGNVVAAGKAVGNYGDPNTGWDFAVEKFNGDTGATLWRQALHGTLNDADSYEIAFAVAIDKLGDVMAGGQTTNTDTGIDFTVVKFDGATGVEEWRRTINGTSNGSDWAGAVTVDGDGNAMAAGVTVNGGSRDFTVAKFDGASGVELWSQVIRGDGPNNGALAVTVDGEGNAVAAGFTANGFGGVDFTVAKFEATLGSERWRQVIGSASGTSGQARAVTVDHAGDVIAAGSVSNLATVVKIADDTTSATPPPDPSGSRVEEADPAVVYTGTWISRSISFLSGGGAVLSTEPSARATVTFTGTGIRWIGYRDEWSGIARVFMDDVLVAEVDTYATPYEAQAIIHTVSGLSNGTHTLVIEVTGNRNPASGGEWIWVDAFDILGEAPPPPDDTTAPSVSLTSPANGTALAGTISVTADASDNVGVTQVQFFDGTTSLGMDTTNPYSVPWNTTDTSNGLHTLTAVALDDAGNSTTSGEVLVSVSNDTTPPSP
jgi:hypothetical protein